MNRKSQDFTSTVFVALATIGVLLIAPFTFAQTVNYYNSVNACPTCNPSRTNTIIPGAINIPVGNPTYYQGASGPSVPNTGVSANDSTSMSGAGNVPHNLAAPGVPNTGAGGDSSSNLFILLSAAFAGMAGLATLSKKRFS